MIRRGRYAMLNSTEYKLISYRGQCYLKSENPVDLQYGFLKFKDENFTKQVKVSELDDAYEIFPYAMVGGYRFSVEEYNEKTGMITLVTNNPFIKEKINVRPYGESTYIIEIPYEEIQICEDKIRILGFERNYYEQN